MGRKKAEDSEYLPTLEEDVLTLLEGKCCMGG